MSGKTFMLVASAVRLLGFNASAIWFDEWVMRYRARLSWGAYLLDRNDYTGANAWDMFLRLVAYGPLWLFRLPALLCSLAALWLAWKITDLLEFDHRQRTAAYIGMAFMPGLIWISQDARFYGAMTMLFMAAVWFALRGGWLGLAACSGLLFYVHPTGPAFAAGAFALAFWRRSVSIKGLMISGAVTSLAWVPRLIQSLSTVQTYGQLFPQFNMQYLYYSSVTALFVDTVSANTLSGLIVFALFVLVAVMTVLKIRSPQVQACAILLYVPAVALVMVSLLYQNVFIYRPVGVLGIPMALLVGTLLSGLPERIDLKFFEYNLAFFASALLVMGFVQYDPSARGGDLDQVTEHVRSQWQSGDTIVYVNQFIGGPADHYLHDLSHCTLTQSDLFAACDLSAPRVWLFWPRDPSLDPVLENSLKEMTRDATPHFTVTRSWQISQVELYLLETP